MANGLEPIWVISDTISIWCICTRPRGTHCGETRQETNEPRPPSHQTVKLRAKFLLSIADLLRLINPFFMLLFKPILDPAH
jgi:hypothetical protein